MLVIGITEQVDLVRRRKDLAQNTENQTEDLICVPTDGIVPMGRKVRVQAGASQKRASFQSIDFARKL